MPPRPRGYGGKFFRPAGDLHRQGEKYSYRGQLFLSVAQDCGALYIYSVLSCARNDGTCKFRLEILRTIPEISFCSADMRGVGHGILSALGETEDAVGQLLLLLIGKSVCHDIRF